MARLATKETSALRVAHEEALKVAKGLRAKQTVKEAELARLIEECDQLLTVEYLAEEPDAVALYEAADARVQAAERALNNLRRGVAKAEEAAARAQAQRQIAENQDAIDRALRPYDKRIERAAKFEKLFEEVKVLYADELADAAKSVNAWPGTGLPDGGMLLSADDVRKAVGVELWRLVSDTHGDLRVIDYTFPGGISGEDAPELLGQSGKAGVSPQQQMPSLQKRLIATKQYAHEVLTGIRTAAGKPGPNAPQPEAPAEENV